MKSIYPYIKCAIFYTLSCLYITDYERDFIRYADHQILCMGRLFC